MKYRHLPLQGAYNVRDLGGYATDGGTTPFNHFLRSDSLAFLTTEDVQLLKDYGVKHIVDLRSDYEIKHGGEDKTTLDPHFTYKNISLFRDLQEVAKGDITKVNVSDGEAFLQEVYVAVLEQAKEAIAEVFRYMLYCEDGGILFHCSVGKDRTGNIAALLLSLAGVSRSDVVADYEVTYTYIKESPQIKKQLESFPEELLYSKPEYIEGVLKSIEEDFGGIEGYLKNIGLQEEELDALKIKLIQR